MATDYVAKYDFLLPLYSSIIYISSPSIDLKHILADDNMDRYLERRVI